MIRAAILAALCIGLMGCGFRPLYGDAALSPTLSSIYVEPIPETTVMNCATG